MFIPPQKHLKHFAKEKPKAQVYLEANHICLAGDLVQSVFGSEENVFVAIYPEKSYFLVSPVSNTFFTKMHQANQHILKSKDLKGTKSLAIHEYMIDHDLHIAEGSLEVEILKRNNMIAISWK